MRKIIITAVITAFLSLGSAITFFHYSEQSPKLTYEVFPVSSFPKENEKLSIYFVQIENSGNKEATDVQCTFIFPKKAKIVDHFVALSSVAMKYNIQDKDITNQISFFLPNMNPSENCRFSLLVEMGGNDKAEIGVRGKGVVGIQRTTQVPQASMWDILSKTLWSLILATFIALFYKRQEFRDFLMYFPNGKPKVQNNSDINMESHDNQMNKGG